MKVKATLKNLRVSPRKVRLVINLIKKMDAGNALVQLSHITKGSGRQVSKLLESAIANAENNFGLEKDNLFVSDAQVGEGPTLKRWLPRAHGRATPIMKRTSNIYLVLEEKIAGIKKKPKAEKTENVKKETETEKTEVKSEKKKIVSKNVSVKKVATKGKNGSSPKKVFQRKSA